MRGRAEGRNAQGPTTGAALENAAATGGGDLATSAYEVPHRPASNLKRITANSAGSALVREQS